MKTISETMKKAQNLTSMKLIAHKQLNELEIKLIHALDFSPHKVEYYRELISQHKSKFSKYLKL